MTKKKAGFDPVSDMDEMALILKGRMKGATMDDETMIKAFNATRQWVVDRHNITTDLKEQNPDEGGVDVYRKKLEAKGSSTGGTKAMDPSLAGLPESLVNRIRPKSIDSEGTKNESGSDGDVDENNDSDSSRSGPLISSSVVTIGGILVGYTDTDGSDPH